MAKSNTEIKNSPKKKWAYATRRHLINTSGQRIAFEILATFESLHDANREIKILAENEGLEYEDAGWEVEEDEYGQLTLCSGFVEEERIVYEVAREDFGEAVDVVMEEGSEDGDGDGYDDFEGEREDDELACAMEDARISKR